MEPFTKLTGVAMPLDRVNVDTDQIIPAVHLKRIERTGYGQFLFGPWRFDANGEPNPDFILNHPSIQNPRFLVAGRNFGCGSSREHAPWALEDYGFRCIIASSFADIFFNNCFQNGLLPVTLPEVHVAALMTSLKHNLGSTLSVDLEAQRLRLDDGEINFSFEIDPFRKRCLLDGLDDIGLTLMHEEKISAYERQMGLSA